MEGCEPGRWSNEPLTQKKPSFIYESKAELQKQAFNSQFILDYIVSQVDNSMVNLQLPSNFNL